MNAPIISVPERGHKEISKEIADSLFNQPGFWHLVERGILTVSHPAPHRVRLNGSCYVGRSLVGGVLLELSEKVENTLNSLISFATNDAFRVERALGPATEIGGLIALLAHAFLEALRKYASRGLDFRYRSQKQVGSLIAGRIDITKSLQLRARGLGHLLAFDRTILDRNTPKNSVLLAAIREIEQIAKAVDIRAEDLSTGRGLSLLFSDSRSAELLYRRRDFFIGSAERLIEDPQERDKDLLALATVLLSHISFEHTAVTGGILPRSWFLNLETLFETAVRRVLRRLLPPSISVVKGSSPALPIFAGTQGMTARPDIVLRAGAQVPAIGDVKYKIWDGENPNKDIYQLLVHASAFGAKVCFLVFPGDRFEARQLGMSTTGCDTWIFVIRVNDMAEDLDRAISMIGLENSSSDSMPLIA